MNMTPAEMSISVMQQHLITIEKLRDRVRHILRCVINLHVDILVIESNVNQMLDDVKELNAELLEAKRLDVLINTLRDCNGPMICHEWPYPVALQATIDHADLAQILNTKQSAMARSDDTITTTTTTAASITTTNTNCDLDELPT